MDQTFPSILPAKRGCWRPQRQKTWHDAIIDYLLAEPTLTQKEIARRLHRSEVSISYIMNSDLFKARYEARRVLVNEALAQAISGKLIKLAIDAIEITHEKLKLQRDKLPFEDLVDVTDKTLTRLGYGTKTAAATSVVINNNAQVTAPISSEELEAIRARLRAEQAKSIEGIPAESGGASAGALLVEGEIAAEIAAEVEQGGPGPSLEQL